MPKKEAVEEVSEVEVDHIQIAFQKAVDQDKAEDDIKMSMIGAGATFKNVTRLYNTYMVDAGLAISKEDKDAIVNSALEGVDLSEEANFDEAVSTIADKAAGVNEKSAASLIRAWAKKNEVECFKKVSGGGGRSGFAAKFYEALIANPKMTEDQATELMQGEDASDNVRRHASHYQSIRKLCNAIAG